MTTNTSIGLSRRTILAGLGSLGAIGIAGSARGVLSGSPRFARHTLAQTNDPANDLLVTWQQWYAPTENDRRAVNAHPDDDGDGVQSYAGTTYDVAAGESALDGVAACRGVGEDALAVEQNAGEVTLSATLPFQGGDGDTIETFYGAASGDPDTGYEAPGSVRMLFYSDGIGRLYLVVLLGEPPDGGGSTVSFDFPGGLPSSGSWVITGDDGSFGTSDVSFQWNAGGDGGVFGPLEPPFSPILVDPDFTDVTGGEWEFLSNESGGPTPISLVTDALVRLSDHGGIASGPDIPLPEAFQSDAAPDQMALIELSDVMPGDSGEVIFDVRTCGTDAYVWLLGTAFSESPGVTTEPEAELGPDEANLAESVMLDVRYDVNKTGSWDGTEPAVFAPGFGPYTDFDGGNPATLAAAFDVLGDGSVLDNVLGGANVIPLDGDDSTPLGWTDGPTASSRDCLSTEDVLSVRVEWEIPTAVGNEIQGDEAGFTLGFYAESCEATDGTISGGGA